jgi:predicted nucleotidyltransferase
MTGSNINKTGGLFGLKDGDLVSILSIIEKEPEVEEAIIFGSRAKGNYKNGSDIDIALKGTGVNDSTTRAISYMLNEETHMPYQFDVLNYHELGNIDLIEHINRVGICFYKREII